MSALSIESVEAAIVDTIHTWLAGEYVNLPDASGPQYKVTLEEDGTLDFSPVDPDAVHPDDAGGAGFSFKVIVERAYLR